MIVAIDTLRLPTVRFKSFAHVFRKGKFGFSIDRDVIVVKEENQIAKL